MSYTSTNKTSSASVKAGAGTVFGVILAAGADAATLILYDNTAGSGTIIVKLAAAANTTSTAWLDVPFSTGCYAALTGTGPSATITYR